MFPRSMIPEAVNGLSVTVSGVSFVVPEIEVRGGTMPVFAAFMPNPPTLTERFSATVPLHPGEE